MKYTHDQWAVELQARKAWDWSLNDSQLSRLHGVCRPCVQKTRVKLGIKPTYIQRKPAEEICLVQTPANQGEIVLPRRAGIYGWLNVVTRKWYIGQAVNIMVRHLCHLKDLRSGTHFNRHLQSSFLKHGETAFHFMVIQVCDKEHLNDAERCWIHYFLSTLRQFGYNEESGGGVAKTISEDTRKRIGDARRGKKMSDAARANMSAARKGQPPSPALLVHLAKLHVASRKRPYGPQMPKKRPPMSEEQRLKISKALTGRPTGRKGCKATAETRLKLSLSHMGKKWSPEQTEKMRTIMTGRIFSDAHRESLSKAFNMTPAVEETLRKGREKLRAMYADRRAT